MARIPKYPFRVVTTIRIGEKLRQEAHNYENLPGALAWRELMLHKPLTTKVEVMVVIDESTPSHMT